MSNIAIKFLMQFRVAVGEMSPYLLFGFLMAGLLSVAVSQERVEQHIGRRGLMSIFKASMFGVPLPLCSCGVIPVGMSLRKHGASKDATVAFLISTPQTGVDSIMVTLSMLGPVFAIIRPIAALLTGMAGGILTMFFGDKANGNGAAEQPAAVKCEDACCAPAGSGLAGNKIARAIKYGFVILPADIGRFLFAGLIIAAVISTIVPPDFFKAHLGVGIVPMLVMIAIGIPMYVCSSASVPVAAALMHAGISPGAALAFLMSGPATNAATITTIWKVLGRRTAVLYLFSIAAGALGFGMLLDLFALRTLHHMTMSMPWMMPQFVNDASGVFLLALLVPSLIRKKSVSVSKACRVESEGAPASEIELAISGMSCSHCVENVTRAILESGGVSSVNVELNPGRAVIKGAGLDVAALASAIEQLGYKVAQPETAGASTPR